MATKITGIERGYAAPAGATVIELKNHTCMPGLIDLHVHLGSAISANSVTEGFSFNSPDYAIRGVANAEKTLMAGFTSLRELGAAPYVSTALRNAINQGIVKGPRIHAAGGVVSTGGHGDPTNGLRAELMGNPGPETRRDQRRRRGAARGAAALQGRLRPDQDFHHRRRALAGEKRRRAVADG